MLHLVLSPFGLGILAGVGGTWLLKRSGASIGGAAGTVAGASVAVIEKGANLFGLKIERVVSAECDVAPASVTKVS